MRQNIDKLNMEMANKMEELENKESQLKDVESRLQLSLRFGFSSYTLETPFKSTRSFTIGTDLTNLTF